MQIIEKNIKELIPYEKNPRKNDKSVDKVAQSIDQFGFRVPVVIDKDNVIVCGHTRYKAAKKLHLASVPCVVADDLTDEQIKAYRLADNKVGEDSEWDIDLLQGELDDIIDIDMADFGFDLTAAENKVVEDDDFEMSVPEEPKSKLGDIYQLGRHRLMCGDSTNIENVKQLVGGAQIDLLLTDPPYNVNYEGNAGKIKNDNMEDTAFRKFLTDAFVCAWTVMKPGAAFHIWHADSEGYNFRGACRDAGFKVRQCLIWVKNALVLGRQDFQWKHEPCLYGEKALPVGETAEYEDEDHEPCLYGWKDGKHYWFKNRKQTTILEFDKPLKSAEHPTMKPIKMFDYEIKCNTKESENVLDLFSGSGTTLMACEQDGRNAYCMEFDPKFVDVIINRWEQFTGEKAILING
jgi:site-specific DNA-methyltransferase (adenine-specific)